MHLARNAVIFQTPNAQRLQSVAQQEEEEVKRRNNHRNSNIKSMTTPKYHARQKPNRKNGRKMQLFEPDRRGQRPPSTRTRLARAARRTAGHSSTNKKPVRRENDCANEIRQIAIKQSIGAKASNHASRPQTTATAPPCSCRLRPKPFSRFRLNIHCVKKKKKKNYRHLLLVVNFEICAVRRSWPFQLFGRGRNNIYARKKICLLRCTALSPIIARLISGSIQPDERKSYVALHHFIASISHARTLSHKNIDTARLHTAHTALDGALSRGLRLDRRRLRVLLIYAMLATSAIRSDDLMRVVADNVNETSQVKIVIISLRERAIDRRAAR